MTVEVMRESYFLWWPSVSTPAALRVSDWPPSTNLYAATLGPVLLDTSADSCNQSQLIRKNFGGLDWLTGAVSLLLFIYLMGFLLSMKKIMIITTIVIKIITIISFQAMSQVVEEGFQTPHIHFYIFVRIPILLLIPQYCKPNKSCHLNIIINH